VTADFPSLDDELRPKPRLKKHTPAPVSDEEIEANSRQLGEKWGASTSISTDPPPAPAPAAKPPPGLPPLAPVTSIRGYIPQYLDDELAVKAAERRVTKTFLIMEAMAKAGYRVEENDMVQDRRKRPKGN
jgi:hypothetical protein